MRTEDKPAFSRILQGLFATYELDWKPGVPDVWWGVFENIDLADFSRACSKYAGTSTYRPRPAAILALIIPPPPKPDELVAMALAARTPIACLARAFLRDYIGGDDFALRNRAMVFIEGWDDHLRRVSTGKVNKLEAYMLDKYIPEQANKLLTQSQIRKAIA